MLLMPVLSTSWKSPNIKGLVGGSKDKTGTTPRYSKPGIMQDLFENSGNINLISIKIENFNFLYFYKINYFRTVKVYLSLLWWYAWIICYLNSWIIFYFLIMQMYSKFLFILEGYGRDDSIINLYFFIIIIFFYIFIYCNIDHFNKTVLFLVYSSLQLYYFINLLKIFKCFLHLKYRFVTRHIFSSIDK